MSDLSLVSVQNSLAFDVKQIQLRQKITGRIAELQLVVDNYRNSTEFLLLILNLIEHLVTKKDKVNKKELAVDILNTYFNYTDVELVALQNNIEFLWANNNIKKVSWYKLFCTGVKELIFLKKKA